MKVLKYHGLNSIQIQISLQRVISFGSAECRGGKVLDPNISGEQNTERPTLVDRMDSIQDPPTRFELPLINLSQLFLSSSALLELI